MIIPTLLSLLLFSNVCLVIVECEVLLKSDCHLYVPQTNSTWKLVFEDHFAAKNVTENWEIQNEAEECFGNGLMPVTNCNLPRNVYQTDGYLVLVSKHEPYLEFNYTGATLTTRQFFSYGRIEVRASQPIGHSLRTRIITRNTSELFHLEHGQVNVASNIMDSVLYRNVLAEESRDFYIPDDLNLFDFEPSLDLHEFHLYGVEWDQEGLVFFLDDLYGEKIKFNGTATGIEPLHQIQLQMGVGGRNYDRPDSLDNFEELEWRCPAFVIDYVRVYEKVAESAAVQSLSLCPTLGAENVNKTRTILEEICHRAEVGKVMSIWAKLGKPILFSVLVLGLMFILFTCYLFVRANNSKRKLSSNLSALPDVTT